MQSLTTSNWDNRYRGLEREREMTSLLEGIEVKNVGFDISLWSEHYLWISFRSIEKTTHAQIRQIRAALAKTFGKLKWKRSNNQRDCDWRVVVKDYWPNLPKNIWLEIKHALLAKNCHIEEYEETVKKFKVVCKK